MRVFWDLICVFEGVAPDGSKDGCAFIFRVKLSQKKS